MATDRLINQTQGEDIIDKLNEIASNVGDIKFGPQVQSSNVVSMTGYAKASTADAISQGDTLNEAIGKLEKKADDNASAVAGKIDKLTGATAGDIATVTATGEIADSTVAIENTLSDSSDAKVPTSKAVGTYVAGKGYAVGVSTSTADHIVTFNGTDGKTLKDSGYTVNTTLTNVATDIPTGSAVSTALAGKVDKVAGKGLSENDYTTTEKNKLSGIEAQANKTVVDASLSDSSTNPVQNKVINTALADKVAGPGNSTSNDIMLFSGTTGKVASDSGVQIETNTTFSDTSDAKIPTSKSIAQNVAGKAVLKNYSVATAKETISASTTIKDAVEQLDYRTTTNQNSISSVHGDINELNSDLAYVLGRTGKNAFTFTVQDLKTRWSQGTWNNNVFTPPSQNYTITVVDNEYIRVTGTATSNTSYTIGMYNPTLWKGWVYSGGTTNVSTTTCISGVNNINYDYGNGVTLTADSSRAIQIAIFAATFDVTFKPMVCTAEDWAISHDFVPYAKSNYQLTADMGNVNAVLEAVL